MQKLSKEEVILQAVEQIKQKGGYAIKIEAEANFDRGDDETEECDYCSEGVQSCDYCVGGMTECSRCEGTGLVRESATPTAPVIGDCTDCNGTGEIRCPNDCNEGFVTCGECNGDWRGDSERGWGVQGCLNFILQRLGIDREAQYVENEIADVSDAAPWLKYIRFYNDHSVDSEVTFTVPLDDPTNVFRLPSIVEAFVALGKEIGNEFDTSGAGLHTAILFNKDCYYPDFDNSLPREQLDNFRRSMKQLLPALYFLGASNETTRELYYRQPIISVGFMDNTAPHQDEDIKYSAIHYEGNAMEFRVFDTCYDNVDQVLDNVVVMSNCLKYLSATYKSPGLDRRITRYTFGQDDDRSVSRFYTRVEHLDMLSRGLQLLKPPYYTIPELKKRRGFKTTKRTLKLIDQRERKNAEIAYDEYAERFEMALVYQQVQAKADRLEKLIKESPRGSLKGKTTAELEAIVAESVERDVELIKKGRTSASDYVQQYMRSMQERRQGRWQVNCTQ